MAVNDGAIEVANAAAVPLVGKKFMNKLGGMMNESASSNVSEFARRQMEKMGWKAGKGLGKQEQGMVTHVKVKKREEFMGVGVEKQKVVEQQNQWWYNVYDKVANKITIDASSSDDDDETNRKSKKKKSKKNKKDNKKKKEKKSKNKRQRDEDAASDSATEEEQAMKKQKKFRIPTDEELFAATGGKLFGRRAYGSCSGKLKRDELHVQNEKKKKKKQQHGEEEAE